MSDRRELNLWGEPFEERPDPRNQLRVLDFKEHPVRIVLIKGEPWWVLADVARVLGYKHAPHAARLLRDKEKGVHQTDTLGGSQSLTVINEPGLYRLILRSDKPDAERFQDWITEEVLPSIRKTGGYSLADPVAKEAKRLKSDRGRAIARLENKKRNKSIHVDLHKAGAKRVSFQEVHKALSRGQFEGREPADLRRAAKLKPYQTPLDIMGEFPLVQRNHALVLAKKVVELNGVPSEGELALIEDCTRTLVDADMARLGSDARFALVDDPGSGRMVIDVIRPGLASPA